MSQPGFHVAASIIDAHPALKAASPQAPTADYYLGDDVYHNGAFMLGANFGFYSSFRPRVGGPQLPAQEPRFDPGTPDAYEFFLSLPPLAEVNAKLFGGRAGYWQEIVDHPNYDEFWQVRSIWKHAKHITPAILNVGGWFDAEDPMGPLHMYRSIERLSPTTDNRLVMGPWSHGGWSRGPGRPAGQRDLRRQDRRGVPRRDPVRVLHALPEGRAAAGRLPEGAGCSRPASTSSAGTTPGRRRPCAR